MPYPIRLAADHPEKLSRGILILRLLFGSLYVGIPHGFCLIFYGIGAMVVAFIAWFAVLFTGKFPLGMFNFIVGLERWQVRVRSYMMFLTDEYPPFNGRE
jgi:hypothetical protein